MLKNTFSRLASKRGLNHPTLVSVLLVLALFALTGINIYLGLQQIKQSKVATWVVVYDELYNSPLRLIFPLVVAMLGSARFQTEMSDNFVSYKRSRQSLDVFFKESLLSGIKKNAWYFASVGVVTTIVATYVAPKVQPGLVDPSAFGLTQHDSLSVGIQQHPLGFANYLGPLAVGAAETIWLVASATLFTVVGYACVLLVRHRVVLLIPLGIFLFQTALAQLGGFPIYALMASFPVPTSHQSFNLLQALTPGLVLLMLSLGVIRYRLERALRFGDYS